jgi:tetratricopeptide (TPR) repeat protein
MQQEIGQQGKESMVPANETLAQARKHHQAGDLAQAEPLYRQVLQAEPGNARAWYLLGTLCHAAHRPGEAEANFRQSLQLNPRDASAHNHLGVVLAQQGHYEEAIGCFREAIGLDRGNVEFWRNLGAALGKLEKQTRAGTAAGQASPPRVDLAEAHLVLAEALAQGDRLDEAQAHGRKALRHDPASFQALLTLGSILKRLGQSEEAITVLEQALRLQPDSPQAHHHLAYLHVNLGDFDKALPHLHEVLRLRPDDAAAYHTLGQLARQGKYQFSDAGLDHLRQLASDPQRSTQDKGLLHFTLAYVLEQRGDYDAAFGHYREGNECSRRSGRRKGVFSREAHGHSLDRRMAVYDRAHFARVAPWGHASEVPVFIVGMPRSGTSLVEQVLSSHPRFAGAGELLDMQLIRWDLPAVLKVKEKYPDCMAQLTPEAVWSQAERYLQRLRRENPQALRVSDKLPENYFHLGLIATLFPRARVIHCRRDPRDTCVSCFCELFENVRWAWSLEDLGHYYRDYERMMAHWRQVLPLPMLEVQYEELVANQEAVTWQLVAFCGLDWDDCCLAFHQTRRTVQTASNVQVRQPLYGTSVGRWRRFQAHLGPLLGLLQPFLADRPDAAAS